MILNAAYQKISGLKFLKTFIPHLSVQGMLLFNLRLFIVFTCPRLNSQIFPEISPTCDRCKQAPACLYHTFWSCSSLLTFWSSIFKLYSKIVGCTIKPCPLLALFGVPSRDLILTNTQLNCIAYSSLLARRLILLNWKSDRPPAFGRWVCDVMYFLKVEKVRYVLQGSTSKFSAIWQPFISYVDQLTIPLNT